ncbi:universal stress protein [Azohydromonas lata]|uniref:Universal stress protein n=1 Tax=Azohydromonas lata TaxID=45677 RepID=A0ABU5I7V2_9BURK|nr:universal stress protein [Azohydromonas lata]MDZ5455173.1 universal stress protein [Azohydromonas lata]
MYRHLLVALDDSPLGDATVTRSVEFARSAGARITFFHAAPDLAATGEGALLYTLDQEAFAQEAAGAASAVLVKAAAAAGAAGVSCGTESRTSDQPAQAIVEAAHRHGCDLVFVSAHGRVPGLRGWLRHSVTQHLLQLADLPVLVSAVESNDACAPAARALGIVAGEHRAIAAVLQGLQHLVRAARLPGQQLDVGLAAEMVRYLREFPGTQHHPKEETVLFRLLRQRTHELDHVLLELERQHGQEQRRVQALADALSRYDSSEAASLEAVGDAVQQLAGTVWEHMGMEEALVFPAARRYLSEGDWSEVAQAFTTHDDPLRELQPGLPLERLFRHVAAALLRKDMAGVAPAAASATHA